jgi:histidinol-phosphate aminotransferase
MSVSITPKPGILDIALYQGGESKLPGFVAPLKLSSNENPFGPPPSAVSAMVEAATMAHRYPSTDHKRAARGAVRCARARPRADHLRGRVGRDHHLLCQAYAGPGDEVLYPEHGFGMYRISALAAGATPVTAPETERGSIRRDPSTAVTERTRLIFIANPANPTGTMLPLSAFEDLAAQLPERCLLVLDGAYVEYAEGYDGGARLVETRDNVVMTRTFSKVYGLGGLRVGYGYAPRAMIEVLTRMRGPFNLSSMALAGAEAALRDTDWVAEALRINADERARLTGGLRQLGIAATTAPRISCWPASPMRPRPTRRTRI